MTTTRIKPQHAIQAAGAAESIEFSAIFGSNVNPKWFEWLMKNSGTYLFTASLLLSVLKLGINVYQFVKNPNKNMTQSASLGWNILHTALIGTAIIGSLAASSVFAVITPALFVTAMGLDTVRNLGLLIWNAGKLASLRYSLRHELKDPEDHFTQLKYASLKKQYVDNIKQHALGSFVSAALTTAVSVIFLFPHIGLGAISATAVTIGSIKLTVAGLVGIGVTGALLVPLTPLVGKFANWAMEKIGLKEPLKNFFHSLKNKFTSTNTNNKEEKAELIPEKQNVANFTISNAEAVDKALHHKINANTFSLHSRLRETIIDHIEDEELALVALDKMINEKISQLTSDIQKGMDSGYRVFADIERPKREQKLHALLLVKQQLHPDEQNVFAEYRSFFKNYDLLNKNRFTDLSSLINHVEKNLPGVKQSFLLNESDTQNIMEALRHYDDKFTARNSVNYVH